MGGRGFESRYRRLEEHLFTFIVVNIVMFVLKRPKINDKRGRGCPIFLKKTSEWSRANKP